MAPSLLREIPPQANTGHTSSSLQKSGEDSSLWQNVKVQLLSVPLPLQGYPSSIKISNALHWCFRKWDGPRGSAELGNTQQADGKKGRRDVRSMEKPQHLFTKGLDKNVTLSGKGTGNTDYVTIFWLSVDLAEVNRTHRRKRSRLWFCCCSVTTLCPTLCNPMDCNTPVFPVLYYLPEFAQTHVHWVSDAIQPSHPQSSPAPPPALNLSQHQGLLQWVSSSHQVIKVLELQLSASMLPVNIQGWFPLGLICLISLLSKGLSRVFSNTTVKIINSLVLSLVYGPILLSVHDYWKNHSFD